jgi:hypothetical protein
MFADENKGCYIFLTPSSDTERGISTKPCVDLESDGGNADRIRRSNWMIDLPGKPLSAAVRIAKTCLPGS